MTVLIASCGVLRLGALGGGPAAPGAYDETVGLLRQSFGSEHAALLARPSARLGGLDRFAYLDADTRPVHLNEAEPELRGVSMRATYAARVQAVSVGLRPPPDTTRLSGVPYPCCA